MKEIFIKSFILGNGFELANNHPTQYGDFIENQSFQNLLKKGSLLARFMKAVPPSASWSDVENELGNYSMRIEDSYQGKDFQRETIRFEQEYNELVMALYEYMNSIWYGISNPKMEELVNTWKNGLCGEQKECALFVTFNYLSWDGVMLQEKMTNNHFVTGFPLYIHGHTSFSVNTPPRIVFGVDEKTVHCQKHQFIVKSYNKNNQAETYFKHIFNARHITIFGCSMGNTDRRYFEPLFTESTGKTVDIYYWGNQGRKEIMARISAMSNLDEFMKNNQVNFIDATPYSDSVRMR